MARSNHMYGAFEFDPRDQDKRSLGVAHERHLYYITEEQVANRFSRCRLLLVACCRASFRGAIARGDAFNEPRRRLPTSSGAYNVMFATWRGQSDCRD